MQMRLARIAGAANARQYLATLHSVTYLDEQTAWLQMHVVGKLTATQIESDRVSCNCFRGRWNSGMKRVAMSGDVIGETVPCRDDTAIGDGQDSLLIGIVRARLP